MINVDLRISILTEAELVLSGRHHIISNASIVNNCIMLRVKMPEYYWVYYTVQSLYNTALDITDLDTVVHKCF